MLSQTQGVKLTQGVTGVKLNAAGKMTAKSLTERKILGQKEEGARAEASAAANKKAAPHLAEKEKATCPRDDTLDVSSTGR